MMNGLVTLADAEQAFGIEHLDYLDKSAELPRVARLAFQGDVAIIARPSQRPAVTPIPSDGFPVVRGENGGNTHALFGPGMFDAHTPMADELTLGTLTVPAGAEVLLSHPEHGGMVILAGTYDLRRQRERADVIRLVQD